MIEELSTAIIIYQEKWARLVAKRKNKAFFDDLRTTAVAWKTEDLADFDARFIELRDYADQIHLGWVNNRWLATIHVRDQKLAGGLTVIKLMQRRPGSTDATGLDHLDFYFNTKIYASAKDILTDEPALKWDEEKNGDMCKWLSIWFENTEAKIRSDTVMDVCCAELQEVRTKVLAERGTKSL